MELYEIKDQIEKVILVAVNTEDEKETNASLDELEELIETAGAIPVGRMIQNRESVNSGTYIGKGKIEELKEYPVEVINSISQTVDTLEETYGIRDVEQDLGGYVVLAENIVDIEIMKQDKLQV